MFRSIWEDVKREFSYGNMVTRIIIINIIAFVAINLIWIFFRISHGWETPELYYSIRNFFMISSDWLHNLTHPWALITHMFLHESFWHILWNMLFLYWFGRIVGDFIGNHRILPLYLLGGLFASLIYFVSSAIIPYAQGEVHYALGASGAVMAIVVASGVISPDYIMRLFLLGDVKLKYIVATLVFLDLIGIASNSNTGGAFAHLGGAFFGWLFVRQLREGSDWSVPVNRFIERINNFFRGISEERQRPKKGPRVVYRNTGKTRPQRRARGNQAASDSGTPGAMSHQEQLDAILDKIKKSGYDSLSEEEKEFLFNASKKN
ncbi:MAG: rhomboid family intramembrane serine protease [Bacteroidota bacterium]